jgi:hypothetical protein
LGAYRPAKRQSKFGRAAADPLFKLFNTWTILLAKEDVESSSLFARSTSPPEKSKHNPLILRRFLGEEGPDNPSFHDHVRQFPHLVFVRFSCSWVRMEVGKFSANLALPLYQKVRTTLA